MALYRKSWGVPRGKALFQPIAENAFILPFGSADTRLTPFGNGSYAPIASNKTDEGRVKNRRVELMDSQTR